MLKYVKLEENCSFSLKLPTSCGFQGREWVLYRIPSILGAEKDFLDVTKSVKLEESDNFGPSLPF